MSTLLFYPRPYHPAEQPHTPSGFNSSFYPPGMEIVPTVSAMLAFSRSFLFTAASIRIMPVSLDGITGVWPATPVAELLGTVMAAVLLVKYRKRYGYENKNLFPLLTTVAICSILYLLI